MHYCLLILVILQMSWKVSFDKPITNRHYSTWKKSVKGPASMVAWLETTRHGEAGSIHQPQSQRCCIYPDSQISKKENTRRASCRDFSNYSRGDPGSRDMSTPCKSSLSWWGRNLSIQPSCHNIQIKHCLRQLPCDPELSFSHSRLLCQKSLWHSGSAEASEAG